MTTLSNVDYFKEPLFFSFFIKQLYLNKAINENKIFNFFIFLLNLCVLMCMYFFHQKVRIFFRKNYIEFFLIFSFEKT